MSGAVPDRLRVAVLDDWEDTAGTLRDDPRLRPWASIEAFADHLVDVPALAQRLAPFDAVLVMRERTAFPRELIEQLPRLRLLVTSGTSTSAIDLDAAAERGVVVSGAPGAGDGTTELTWALILALAREVPAGDQLVRSGRWLDAGVGTLLRGRTLAVLGLGRIGSKVATIGQAFGMEVVAWSPTLTGERAAASGARAVGFEELFDLADVLTIHVPLTDGTRGLVDAACLARLRPGAMLVNTSRAPVVDRDALLATLEAGALAGVALDVFDLEPLPADDPIVHAPGRVVLSPHRGYVVDATMTAFRRAQADALVAFREGRAGHPVRRPGG